jgi:ABC-type spermidine/putrescine transport system permease subunit II
LPAPQRGSAAAAWARLRAGKPPVRRRPIGLWAAALAGYAFLYVPLLIVIVYSFNDSRLIAEWVGFTFGW